MRIGVDFRTVSQHQGGMAVYARNLFDHLKRLDKKNKYFLLRDQAVKGWGGQQKLQWLIGEHYWSQIKLVDVFNQKRLDLGFFPNPPVPFLLGVPIVLTIPDMSFAYDSNLAGWIKLYLFIMYFLSAHKAYFVITFSNNSKLDISKMLKIDPNKIVVIPLAAPETINVQPSHKVAQDLKQLDISQPFILAIPGTFLPRKNMSDLLLAFADMGKRFKTHYRLVIVGIPTGNNYQQTVQLSQKIGISKRVIFTGRLNDSQLSSLYCGASLFVCTSLYEGFGLPILEAMKCGTPVISYANSSLPEVVGRAGILVHNYTELSESMHRVLENRTLQNTLKRKGLEHAAAYSWDRTAAIFLAHLPHAH